ncbi:MAG: tryptophan--tRNA ligase [Chitinophagales bacterium]
MSTNEQATAKTPSKEGSESKKRILSCIQPTGDIHLGNYFGAVQNWIKLQETYECFYGVVDYHAMTMPYKAKDLHDRTLNLSIDLIACGVDVKNLFIQSLIPEHSELSWILSNFTSYGELSRMTQFKDKSQQLGDTDKDAFVSAGLFTYPVLQAADILIYKAQLVPVGKDQEQHLELSRNIAIRFNKRLKTRYFYPPKPLFTEIPKLLSLADPTKKMSKSLGEKHYIAMLEPEKSIRKKIRSAVTDTGDGTGDEMSAGVKNLFELMKASGAVDAHDHYLELYNSGNRRYGDLKNAVADAVVNLTNDVKNRKAILEANRGKVIEEIYASSANVRKTAQQTLTEVREIAGLPKLRY